MHWEQIDEREWAYATPGGRMLLSICQDKDQDTGALLSGWQIMDASQDVGEGDSVHWARLGRFLSKEAAMKAVEAMFA